MSQRRGVWPVALLLLVALVAGCSLHSLPDPTPHVRAVDRYENAMNLVEASANNLAGQVSDLGARQASEQRISLVAPYLDDLQQAQDMLTNYTWSAPVREPMRQLIDAISAYRTAVGEYPYIQGMKITPNDAAAMAQHVATMTAATTDVIEADNNARTALGLRNWETRCQGSAPLVPWPADCTF